MTYRSSINPFDKTDYSNFAFKKAEILEILQALDSNFAFDQVILDTQILENISSAVSYVKADYDYKFFLFKKPLLTFHEASCIMTGYDPHLVEQCQNDTNFKQNFSDYLGAKDYIDVCTDAQMLCYNSMDNRIYSEDFKKFLANDGTFIDGFNDDLKISTSPSAEDSIKFKEKISDLELDLVLEKATVDKLNEENTKLKTELLEKEQKIRQLESIQTTVDESKLGNTRAENNVAKLILALSAQANIDTSRPYAQYESLKTQAELLGIDKFPSGENVASWLKKANSQNPN